MCSMRSVAVGLLIASVAAPTEAQVVTREITQQPVETTVTRYPNQTVITRWPLPSAPAVGTTGAAPGVAPAYRPYGVEVQTFPAVTETFGAPVMVPVESAAGARSVRTVTVRREIAAEPPTVRKSASRRLRGTASSTVRTRTVARSATAWPAKSVQRARATPSSRTRAVARTTVTAPQTVGQPLVLTPPQRRIIYQNILQQRVVTGPAATEVVTYPPAPALVQPDAVTGYAVSYPGQVVPSYPSGAYASSAYPVTYSLGTTIPAGVSIAPVPDTVWMQVPQARPYYYGLANNRVLLVDPTTGTIVADVTQ